MLSLSLPALLCDASTLAIMSQPKHTRTHAQELLFFASSGAIAAVAAATWSLLTSDSGARDPRHPQRQQADALTAALDAEARRSTAVYWGLDSAQRQQQQHKKEEEER